MPETRLDLDDALRAMLADTRPIAGHETIRVADACGRIVAADVHAPIDLPPFAASAMDGYALRSGEASGEPPYRLTLAGTSYAGHPLRTRTPEAHAVRIFTGAPVPDDLDAVAIQEDCTRDGDAIVIHTPVSAGDNVRHPGHDVGAGTRILDCGRRITTFDQGWLTACGLADVAVRPRAIVGIFSTGDELLDAGAEPAPGQIFDANRSTVAALLRGLPVRVEDYGIVPDDPDAIRRTLQAADADCDLVLTSGGVSVGDADWVRQVVEELGTLSLWRLNLKPGKPVAYGRLRRAAFFGLPGNPVSAIVTALLLVKPVLERLCGGRPSAPLAVPAQLDGTLRHQPGREEFQRGTLTGERGRLTVSVTGDQSSNRLASFAEANCLIRVPKETGDLTNGSTVSTLPFYGLLS